MEPSSVDPKTEEVISLWESAAAHSEAGRFHEAVVGYERARQLLEDARSGGESDGSSDRVASVLKALLERVHAELKDHLMLLEGNHYLALGLKRGADPKTIKKVWRAFALLYHPDKNRKLADTSALFRAGQAAHDTLSNPDSAAAYTPKVKPEEWLARRAAETNRLARLEQRRRQKAADQRTYPTSQRRGTENAASSEPKVAAAATSSNAKPSAAESSMPSARTHSARRWLRAEELRGLRVGELVAQLATVGLAGAVKPGMERTELEQLYLDAAAAATAVKGNYSSRTGDGSGARSEEKQQHTPAAAPHASDRRHRAEQQASSTKTARNAYPSSKGNASGVVPEPPAPRPKGGVKVTKDDLRRHEARMFGRRRNTNATTETTAGKPPPRSATAAAAADSTAADFKSTSEDDVNMTGSKTVPTSSPSPMQRKEQQEDKGMVGNSSSHFANDGGDIAAAYSAAYTASCLKQSKDRASPFNGAESKVEGDAPSTSHRRPSSASSRSHLPSEATSTQSNDTPSWERPKPRRGRLDEDSDADEDEDEDADAESQEDHRAPVESKDEFIHNERCSEGADSGVVLRWGQARINGRSIEGGSEDEDEDIEEEVKEEEDDEEGSDDDDDVEEWDFAFDMTSLRWGAAYRRDNDDDEDEDEDEEGIEEEGAELEPHSRSLPMSLALRDIRERLNERHTPEKYRTEKEVDSPMVAEAKP